MVLARTVADGCDRERNVERTHPQPPDPQSETGTLATHSGKPTQPAQVWMEHPPFQVTALVLLGRNNAMVDKLSIN